MLEAKDAPDGVATKGVWRSIAGMSSSAGGLLVIGAKTSRPTGSGVDVITAVDGVDIDEEEWRRIRQGILDAVRPTPSLRDATVMLGTGRRVIFVLVDAEPAGLPCSANGRYWVRVGDQTLPMDWNHVRRRFQAVADREKVAARRAVDVITETMHSADWICEYVHGGDDIDLAHDESPFTRVALVPLSGRPDLGTTARSLVGAVEAVVHEEHAIWADHTSGQALGMFPFGLGNAERVSSGTGLLMGGGSSWRIAVLHDGSVGFVCNYIVDNITPHQQSSLAATWSEIASWQIARMVGVSLALQRGLDLAGSSHVVFRSGLSLGEADGIGGERPGLPQENTVLALDLPIRGGATAQSQFVRTVVQRMRDTFGTPSVDVVEPDIEGYLDELASVP